LVGDKLVRVKVEVDFNIGGAELQKSGVFVLRA
jgi:hypothetical protein